MTEAVPQSQTEPRRTAPPDHLYRNARTGERAELAVEVTDLIKSYGEFRALKGANFNLQVGEVHALMGQNGAGKSTLIKVLAGVENFTSGTLRVFGEDLVLTSPLDALKAGIAVVYQDLSLIPSMSVADNLFLNRELTGPGGFILRGKMIARSRRILETYGLPIDPRTKVEELPFAYRQLTEIAKALLSDVRILVLDEPTSALTDDEAEILFTAVRNVVARGVAVIYVTHRLNEVFKICDRVTVIRDGQTEGSYKTTELNARTLAAAIVGPKAKESTSSVSLRNSADRVGLLHELSGPPVAELVNVQANKVDGVNVQVRKGEVLGLAGALGSGRTEILETLFGLRKMTSGQMRLNGRDVNFRSPLEAIAAGVGLVPEDRHGEGLVLSHSIERNIALPALNRLSQYGRFLKKTSVARAAQAIFELSVKASSPNIVLSSLSGGNQQKVVFGKWGNPPCSLLLLDEPTVGVDIGAREEIYTEIFRAASKGTAIIVVSSDLSELLLLCDRICIVRNHKVLSEVMRDDIESEDDLHHRISDDGAPTIKHP